MKINPISQAITQSATTNNKTTNSIESNTTTSKPKQNHFFQDQFENVKRFFNRPKPQNITKNVAVLDITKQQSNTHSNDTVLNPTPNEIPLTQRNITIIAQPEAVPAPTTANGQIEPQNEEQPHTIIPVQQEPTARVTMKKKIMFAISEAKIENKPKEPISWEIVASTVATGLFILYKAANLCFPASSVSEVDVTEPLSNKSIVPLRNVTKSLAALSQQYHIFEQKSFNLYDMCPLTLTNVVPTIVETTKEILASTQVDPSSNYNSLYALATLCSTIFLFVHFNCNSSKNNGGSPVGGDGKDIGVGVVDVDGDGKDVDGDGNAASVGRGDRNNDDGFDYQIITRRTGVNFGNVGGTGVDAGHVSGADAGNSGDVVGARRKSRGKSMSLPNVTPHHTRSGKPFNPNLGIGSWTYSLRSHDT